MTTDQILALVIAAVSYIALAVGHVPLLKINRAGIAMIGGVAMIAVGLVDTQSAPKAVPWDTVVLLFGLMIVSSQLLMSGFYTSAASLLLGKVRSSKALLAILMACSAFFAALLTNDVICMAWTPMMVMLAHKAKLNPIVLLIGLAMAANIGAGATLIGNPPNIVIAENMRLDFFSYLAWAIVPVVVSLVIAWGFLCLFAGLNKTEFVPKKEPREELPPLDKSQAIKGMVAVVVLLVLFFLPIPRSLSAIVVASVLLLSHRFNTDRFFAEVDWSLIVLLIGLSLIIAGLEQAKLPEAMMQGVQSTGINLNDPAWFLVMSAGLANVVSSVPSVMLLLAVFKPTDPMVGHAMALGVSFAANFLVIASLANMIVFEEARKQSIRLTFWQHAKLGVPVTILTLLVALGWILVT